MSEANTKTESRFDADALESLARDSLRSPSKLRERVKQLQWQKEHLEKSQALYDASLKKIEDYLGIADKVTAALETLSSELFAKLVGNLEKVMTNALQDILEHPIKFRAIPRTIRNATALEFAIERDGNEEDVKRGQGGSVHNILSVGLRLFALATLVDEHRTFLVLDEQDCWLRPKLVPRLVKIVHETGEQLGFQVLMISHHDTAFFRSHADKIYSLEPKNGTIKVSENL